MSTPAAQKKVWIGFDLGGTKMMAVVFDKDLRVLGKRRRKTRGSNASSVSLERITETIDQALIEAGATPDQVAGVGAGCPGPLDLQKGIILRPESGLGECCSAGIPGKAVQVPGRYLQ